MLEVGVLPFEFPQALHLRKPHPAILALPAVIGLRTDVMRAADRHVVLPALLRLPQDTNELLGLMMRLLHDVFPCFAQKPSHQQCLVKWGPINFTFV